MVESVVWVTQSGIGHATRKVAQWTANGESGQDGDFAL